MIAVCENLSLTILVVTTVSLLLFGIIHSATATGPEIRLLADLNSANGGVVADGRVDYRERGLSMRLNLEVEDLSPNSTLAIEISGKPLGTIRTNSLGMAELELNTNDDQVVPKVLRGDLVQIFRGPELVLSGSFREDDGNNGIINQVPITPVQNSSMQAADNSTGIITTVIMIPQDADDLGPGAYSPNPASVNGGSTVTWNNIDSTPHSATADDGSFDTGIINGGSSGSVVIRASSGVSTISYHCSVHPEMRGTLQVVSLSSVPSNSSALHNAPIAVANNTNTSAISSDNSTTIQSLQQEILDLRQTVDALQQTLMTLQQSLLPQDGNVTTSMNNNTSVSSIEEEHPPVLSSSQPVQLQQQQQQNQTVSIVLGSSTLIDNPGFQPNQIQIRVGDTVIWTNDDSQPHTVTSGSNGVPDDKFNSSPNFIPLMTPGATFSHTFTEAGEYPYFCLLHPNMVGKVSVVD
jgi:plastocyanin